ncbi:MAG: hypothetical protein DYH05_02805 [Acidobacteria bacterium ACB1]|nr:hypothetical protein [Pyrinomonadaceae bacterium]MCE7961407.1 hypothetical protein [Acidobacteria bacterium ACB1]RIJ94542.1 MAG: hypothetical protein DCC44_04245 [Acidobacteriota bacterium]
MFYLIEYERKSFRTVLFKEFASTEHEKASKERLELELELNERGIDHEVVILEAANKEALRRTHRRYFNALAA